MCPNKIGIDAIRSRVVHGRATNDDCRDLLEAIDNGLSDSDFLEGIESAVERAIEDCISQSRIVDAVQTAVLNLKK